MQLACRNVPTAEVYSHSRHTAIDYPAGYEAVTRDY